MGKKEYYCLNCKKQVDVHLLGYGTNFLVCKQCWGNRVIKLEKLNRKEFKELMKKFRQKMKET
jgi:DNA-directed RNA polymerase subunit RPC12/RpoP